MQAANQFLQTLRANLPPLEASLLFLTFPKVSVIVLLILYGWFYHSCLVQRWDFENTHRSVPPPTLTTLQARDACLFYEHLILLLDFLCNPIHTHTQSQR